MTKIAFVTPIYLPARLSGSGVVTKQWAEFLAELNDFEVHVITSNARTARYWYNPVFGKKIDREQETINNVKIHRLPCAQYISAPAWLLSRYIKHPMFHALSQGPYLRGLKRLLTRQVFDVVHSSPFPHYFNYQVAQTISRLNPHPKFIATPFFHTELKQFYHPKLREVLKQADVTHTVTQTELRILAQDFNLPRKKFTYIPLGLKSNKYHSQQELTPQIKNFRQQHQLKDRKIILFAGNKGPLKGTPHLVKATAQLYSEDSRYLLMTIGSQGSYWENLKKQLPKDALLDLGFVDKKTKELAFAACDVYAQPSKSESFGLTYLEAWQKRKPVIGVDIPSSREIIAQNQGGLLVPFGDSKQLYKAIMKLAKNKKLARKLGKRGHTALREKFNHGNLLPLLQNLFSR